MKAARKPAGRAIVKSSSQIKALKKRIKELQRLIDWYESRIAWVHGSQTERTYGNSAWQELESAAREIVNRKGRAI